MLPVHVRRPAHRALVRDGAVGRRRALQAHDRLQRAVPDGLRRLRPARRERRDQERDASRRMDAQERRAHARPAEADGRDVRLVARSRSPPTRSTTSGRSGGSCSSSSTASPTRRRPPSGGARRTRPSSPTSRSSTASANAATASSPSATWSSGSSASPTTPTNCSTSARCSGRIRSTTCSATGSAAARART